MTTFTDMWTNPEFPGTWALIYELNGVYRFWNVEGAPGQQEVQTQSLVGWTAKKQHTTGVFE